MMFPLSMTGFGRGEWTGDEQTWTVELRSVNHRFRDIRIKMDPRFASLEDRIKKEISRFFSRGHVDVSISVSGEQGSGRLSVNVPLALQYKKSLQTLCHELNLTSDSSQTLDLISTFRDVIVAVDRQDDQDEIWLQLRQALAGALKSSQAMRQVEGENMKKDLLHRLELISATIEEVEQVFPELVAKKEQLLKKRLDKLLGGIELDPMRLAQEVALMADKSDVTEEIVRLKSHIQQFGDFLDLDEAVGRRLDFLLQEFLREVNTLASKINDASIAHQTVSLKNEIEKMREQVQNLE